MASSDAAERFGGGGGAEDGEGVEGSSSGGGGELCRRGAGAAWRGRGVSCARGSVLPPAIARRLPTAAHRSNNDSSATRGNERWQTGRCRPHRPRSTRHVARFDSHTSVRGHGRAKRLERCSPLLPQLLPCGPGRGAAAQRLSRVVTPLLFRRVRGESGRKRSERVRVVITLNAIAAVAVAVSTAATNATIAAATYIATSAVTAGATLASGRAVGLLCSGACRWCRVGHGVSRVVRRRTVCCCVIVCIVC